MGKKVTLFACALLLGFLVWNHACSKADTPSGPAFGNPNGTGSHDVTLGGAKHQKNYCEPLQYCARCHGPELRGGDYGEPSCFKCHADKWNGPSCGKNTHTASLGGVKHAPNYCSPFQNCTSCHGSDLRGGTGGELSCFKCHADKWNGPSCGKNNHTVSLGGVGHGPNYCFPYQNCTSCHGSNLRGGSNGEPSCLKCHNQTKWMNCGSVQHNHGMEGVRHATNLCKPLNDCVQCHGNSLQGGPNGEPRCTKCHGQLWQNANCGKGD